MKKQFLSILFFLSISLSLFSNDSITSKVYIYREYGFYGSTIVNKIYMNDAFQGRIKNNSFFVIDCEPGVNTFKINNQDDTRLILSIEKGKTYFVRLGLKYNLWTTRFELLQIDSLKAMAEIYNGMLNDISAIALNSFFRPRNRLEINFSYGKGFNNIDLIPISGGNFSKLSCGGGFGMGLYYGYEINRYFDIAAGLKYQFSILNPFLNNAWANFNRGIFSVTPSYILPVRSGEKMRIKLGAGYDFYILPEYIIESESLQNGYNDTWHYHNTSGFHIKFNYEMNFGSKWMLSYALKYYYVAYKFKSSSKFFPLEGNDLLDPNGSGIDFSIGFNYLF